MTDFFSFFSGAMSRSTYSFITRFERVRRGYSFGLVIVFDSLNRFQSSFSISHCAIFANSSRPGESKSCEMAQQDERAGAREQGGCYAISISIKKKDACLRHAPTYVSLLLSYFRLPMSFEKLKAHLRTESVLVCTGCSCVPEQFK